VPPFAETREYVRRVLALYGSDRHRYTGARLALGHPHSPTSSDI